MKTVKIILSTIVALMGFMVVSKVNAAQLKNLQLVLSNSIPAESSTYTFNFQQVTAGSLGRMTFQFCKQASGASCDATGTNLGALAAEPSAVSANLGSNTDWDSTASDAQTVLAVPAALVPVTTGNDLSITFDGIVNGPLSTACDAVANSDTCYVRITQYNALAAGTALDSGTVTYTLVDSVTVTAKVDPTFSFTVTGVNANTTSNGIVSSEASDATHLPFGNLQAGAVKYTMHKLKVATNTQGGYTVTAKMLVQMKGVYNVNNIDPFAAPWTAPTTWTAPTGTIANDNTGWFGGNTSDADVANWTASTAQKFGGIGTDAVPVMTKASPDNGTEADAVYVAYGISANMYQPSDAYEGTLVYNAVPTY